VETEVGDVILDHGQLLDGSGGHPLLGRVGEWVGFGGKMLGGCGKAGECKSREQNCGGWPLSGDAQMMVSGHLSLSTIDAIGPAGVFPTIFLSNFLSRR
jgi:hypothetical protein